MPINDDIKFYLTGGVGNSDPDLSLGNARSTTEIISSTNANLFENVTSGEASGGSTKYRCISLRNEGVVSYDLGVFLETVTESQSTKFYLANGSSGLNGTEPVIADEDTEPPDLIYKHPSAEYDPLVMLTLAPNDFANLWLKRVISAGAGGSLKDYIRLTPVET